MIETHDVGGCVIVLILCALMATCTVRDMRDEGRRQRQEREALAAECTQLYARAHTNTDSLAIDLFRPHLGRYGGTTCLASRQDTTR